MEERYKYNYPVEELDKTIDKIYNGIQVVIPDDMMDEVKIRYMELTSEDDDSDDTDEDIDSNARNNPVEKVNRKINEKKRSASRDNAFIVQLSDEQKEQIRREMETSIVRPNYDDEYNTTDDKKNENEEFENLKRRLAGLRAVYYHQADYVNAMNIIKEAIEYSLSVDYPWMSKQNAIEMFNKGELKFSFCNIPKLFLGYKRQITDPKILSGIMSGEIKMATAEEIKPKRKKNTNSKPVKFDYDIVSNAEYSTMVDMNNKGIETPLDPMIAKIKAKSFNRCIIPKQKSEDIIPLFDWSQDNAAIKYQYEVSGKNPYEISRLASTVNDMNELTLNPGFTSDICQFFQSLNRGGNVKALPYNEPDKPVSITPPPPETLRLEQQLLASITANNIQK